MRRPPLLPIHFHGGPEGKTATSSGRFFIERKTCLSAYSLSMLYGAAVLAPVKYVRPFNRVWIRVGRTLRRLPLPLVRLSRPFNRYLPGTWGPTRKENTRP